MIICCLLIFSKLLSAEDTDRLRVNEYSYNIKCGVTKVDRDSFTLNMTDIFMYYTPTLVLSREHLEFQLLACILHPDQLAKPSYLHLHCFQIRILSMVSMIWENEISEGVRRLV